MYLVDGILTCDDGIHVDDPACLTEVAVAGLCGIVVTGIVVMGIQPLTFG